MFGLVGCQSNSQLVYVSQQDATAPGTPISVEKLSGYSALSLRVLFWWQGLSKDFHVANGMDLYRVVYLADSGHDELVKASGLLAYPRTQHLRGVVSWQHGTTSLRTAAPSNLDVFNGLLPAAVFASRKYILFAPDYHGFGISEIPHSYYVTSTIVGSVTGLLEAGKSVVQHNNG